MANDLPKAGKYLNNGLKRFPNDFQLLFNFGIWNLQKKRYKIVE
jgi:hypothetical protein